MDTYADDLAALIDTLDLQRPRAGRVLHRWRRGRPLRRPARHRPGGQDRAGLRGPAVHAADRRTIRAGCRSRCSTASAPARWPTARRPTRTWPTDRSSGPTGRGRTRPAGCGTPSGCRACRPATATPGVHRGLLRHRLPAGPGRVRRADPGHPRRRRPGGAVRGRRPGLGGPDQGRRTEGLPRRPARHHRHPQGGTLGRPADIPESRERLPAKPSRGMQRPVVLTGR